MQAVYFVNIRTCRHHWYQVCRRAEVRKMELRGKTTPVYKTVRKQNVQRSPEVDVGQSDRNLPQSRAVVD